ncbi:hypothetical protein AVEN_264557-1 [Araneus ventricosus]|uniref:Uncharacterized protein n=1 Tax=Araneus ventricosus TaxID=182803 RepID=A0A4Y2LD58_ARAVE|nr:hypothetical protein AVEN_264557-1 [Araneus ventricosus]
MVQNVSYDATVTGYVPHVSRPYLHLMTVTLNNFDQVRSRACSVSIHRILFYGQDRHLLDVATSATSMDYAAKCLLPHVSLQSAHDIALADSDLRRETSGPFRRNPGRRC